jgi:Na+/H+-translocating membrane pyrophosphatase
MRERWVRIGALASALFAINVIARLVSRFGYGDGTGEHLTAQERLGWIALGATALMTALAAGWWVRLRPQGEVGGELAGAAGVAGLLSVLVGPFVSEPSRFSGGVGGVIIELSVYWGIAALGAIVGVLLVIAAGRDHRSRQLRQYAQARATKPRRPVRR